MINTKPPSQPSYKPISGSQGSSSGVLLIGLPEWSPSRLVTSRHADSVLERWTKEPLDSIDQGNITTTKYTTDSEKRWAESRLKLSLHGEIDSARFLEERIMQS
jgi:hypothetical protein